MFRTLLYRPSTQHSETGGEELIAAWENDSEAIVWVDLADNPADEEGEFLRRRFGIHPLAIQDAQRDRHPPKLERFDGYLFLLLKALNADTPSLDSGYIQLAMFIGHRFLVTRHSGASPSVEAVWSQESGAPQTLQNGPDEVALIIARRMVDRYLHILMQVESRLDEIEDEIFQSPQDNQLEELIGYRTALEKLRRTFNYHVEIFAALVDDRPAVLDPEMIHLVTDVYEHLERQKSLSELYYSLAVDLIDGYISVASHRLNQIMKVLTIVTTIFVPLGFLAGIYGMNFENIPELKSRYGYFILLAIMASVVVMLLALFRRKRWL